MTCERCKLPITSCQARESYAYPNDGRWVHSACVGELCRQILSLMAAVPVELRLYEPEGEE